VEQRLHQVSPGPHFKGPNKGKLQDGIDHGKLPRYIPEPTIVAYPNHRRKQITGELMALDTAQRVTMTRIDTTWIGKNFEYTARSLKRVPEDQYYDKAKTVLNQHFIEPT
jgi:hypothetical protein